MRDLIRRAAVAAGAAVVLAGAGAGAASAGSVPVLGWAPVTSPGSYNYGFVPAGHEAVQVFTLVNSGSAPTPPLAVTLAGPAAFTKTPVADTCTGTSLGVNKSCHVTVTYAPASPGQAGQATLIAGGHAIPPVVAGLTLFGAARYIPALSAAPSGGGPAGSTTVTDTATLAGGHDPTGSIQFHLYGPSTTAACTGTPVDTQSVTVSGDGSYTTPAGATPSRVGSYWWTASYGGDAANNPAVTSCGAESVAITKASPSITTSPSPGVPPGDPVTDTATLTGSDIPTGMITFDLYGPSTTADCSTAPVFTSMKPVTATGSAASAPFTPAQPGTYWWTASYPGDANNTRAATGCGAEQVTIGPHIYWADRGTGTLMEANLDGTGVTALVTGQNSPSGVAADGGHIYWTDFGAGTLMEANLDGTGVTTLVTGQNSPSGVAVDGSHIYWADVTDANGDFSSGTINEVNPNGSGVTALVVGQNFPVGVAVDSSHIYWADFGGGTLMKANLDGTGATTLVTGQNFPYGVAVFPQ